MGRSSATFCVAAPPFQQRAAGTDWDSIGSALRQVTLSLTRVAGLGWLVVALLLTVFPIASLRVTNGPGLLIEQVPPAIGLACS